MTPVATWKSQSRIAAALSISLITALAISACSKEQTAATAPPAVPVKVAMSTQETIPVVTEFVGRAHAYRSVEIMARVEGILDKRHFVEGSMVKTGQLLYSIERANYIAALKDAEAMLAKQQATAVNAKSREARLAPLIKENAISQTEYDNAVAAMAESAAAVAAAESQVDRAKLNLGYTQVYATESGRIGRSEVPEGRLVGKGEPTKLTVIDKNDPMYVEFSVSDTDAIAFRKAMESGAIRKNGETSAQVLLPDGSSYDQSGNIDFADMEVSETSGTISLRAVLPNKRQQLLPGMFLRVKLTSGEAPNSILVPKRAVIKSPTGHSIWVVRDGKAERRDVVVGTWYKDQWVISGGLGAGETVVVDGTQKLRVGAAVNAQPDDSPASAPAATPAAR